MKFRTIDDFSQVEGKQIDCVQSVVRRGGTLVAFRIRFTDDLLLKIESSGELSVRLVHESAYLSEESKP